MERLLVPNNLVRDTNDNSGHPLLEKGTFEQLHRNEIIETRPQILHFGGFQIHKDHVHVLRILNISPSSLRLAVIGPSTPWFKINYDKKGLLAPGMAEEITVTFTPHEWRYYYDTIKIFCGELSENLLVPIHAYPSANDIALPRIVDFGKVAIGTSRTKVIPLSCKIPIQFEFEITILEAHPDFEVTPLQGVIPPDGTTNVAITFLPTKHRTARTELKFNISQFDFDPVTVTVVGSCLPDLSREEVLQTGTAEIEAVNETLKQEELRNSVKKLQNKRNRQKIDVRPPTFPTEAERIVQDVKIPTSQNQTSTNFVLNQTAGKLPLKDLFSFIKDQREAAERRKRKAEQSKGKDEAEEEEEDEDRQAMELRFEMQYREIEKYDKEKELKGMVATGEDPPTEADINKVKDARLKKHSKLLEANLREDAERVESALSQVRVAVPITYQQHISPHWDEYANDAFSMRLQVIDRFVRAGSRCLMRVRAKKRAEKLRDAMKIAGVSDRASCKAWVDAENKAAAAGGGGGSSAGSGGEEGVHEDTQDDQALPVVRIPEDFVLPAQIPTSQSSMNSDARISVDVQPLDNFEEFNRVEIRLHLDYKVLSYQKMDVPPAAAYMRPNTDRRTPHVAALEEHSVRGIRGDILDGAEEPYLMPESFLLAPKHDLLEFITPSPKCRTYIGFPDFTECDFEYRLSRPVPLRASMETQPLLPEDIASDETPWLTSWRRTRQLTDPFQHFDPCPASIAEGGGRFGPRLMSDFGGERIRFMPIGGFNRDIPSDTDSDEREDFELEAPSDEAHTRANKLADVPLTVDLWQKEKLLEDGLQDRFAKNGCALRERLREFNVHLSSQNKLYLG